MNEKITLVMNGFYQLTALEKLKMVDEINRYFDSNEREPIRNENEERFAKIDTSKTKCICCKK